MTTSDIRFPDAPVAVADLPIVAEWSGLLMDALATARRVVLVQTPDGHRSWMLVDADGFPLAFDADMLAAAIASPGWLVWVATCALDEATENRRFRAAMAPLFALVGWENVVSASEAAEEAASQLRTLTRKVERLERENAELRK